MLSETPKNKAWQSDYLKQTPRTQPNPIQPSPLLTLPRFLVNGQTRHQIPDPDATAAAAVQHYIVCLYLEPAVPQREASRAIKFAKVKSFPSDNIVCCDPLFARGPIRSHCNTL